MPNAQSIVQKTNMKMRQAIELKGSNVDKTTLPENYIKFVKLLDDLDDGCPDYKFVYGKELIGEESITSGVLWHTKACESYTFSDANMDCEYFKDNDDFDWEDFESFAGAPTLTKQEIQDSYTIGLVDEGFIIINTHDQSIWMIFSDYFLVKCANSFAEFLEKNAAYMNGGASILAKKKE